MEEMLDTVWHRLPVSVGNTITLNASHRSEEFLGGLGYSGDENAVARRDVVSILGAIDVKADLAATFGAYVEGFRKKDF